MQLGFSPWPGNLHMPQVRPKKERKKKKKKKLKVSAAVEENKKEGGWKDKGGKISGMWDALDNYL